VITKPCLPQDLMGVVAALAAHQQPDTAV